MKKILIIDPNVSDNQKWSDFLKSKEYNVIQAHDGEEGVEVAVKERPHIVFMDWVLPKLDASSVAKMIKTKLKNYFMYLVIMNDKKEVKPQIQANDHVDGYIEKPFDQSALLAKVKQGFKLVKSFHMLAYMNFQQKKVLDEKENIMLQLEKEKKEIERKYEALLDETAIKDKTIAEHNERLDHELELASRLQHELVPKSAPTLSNYNVNFRYIPMHQVGGDYFDFIHAGETRLGVLLSDVSGHGIASAFITSMIKTAVTNHKNFVAAPKKVLYIMNKELAGRIHGNFVTAFYGVLNLEEPRLRYSTAGHPPFLVYRKETNEVEEHVTDNMILGVVDEMIFEEDEIVLNKGDRVLFYTDGIYEVFDDNKVEFGLGGLKKSFIESATLKNEEVADFLIDTAKEYSFNNEVDDDVALIVIEVK